MTSVDPNGFPNHVAADELIESAWGNAVVDNLKRVARQFAAVGGGGSSGGGIDIVTLTVPAVPIPTVCVVQGHLRVDIASIAGTYNVNIVYGATPIGTWQTSVTGIHYCSVLGVQDVPANVAPQFTLRGGGTANVTVFGDPTINRIVATSTVQV